jgi:hypothetical protein
MKPARLRPAPSLRSLANGALVVGAVLAVPALARLAQDPIQFERSYLVALLFVLATAAGSLALLLLHRLTGGQWGEELDDVLTASARTLPWVALLFLPLLANPGNVFPVVAGSAHGPELTNHEAVYFERPFFTARALLYFIAWIWLALAITKRGASASGKPRRSSGFAGFGLIAYFFTMTFAAMDWGMSLRGSWSSSVYGLLFIVGQALSALPLAILARIFLDGRRSRRELSPAVAIDLGTLLFAAVMIWAYIGFSQLLIIWSANLPEEVTWYASRLGPNWRRLALVMVVFHFLVPFLLLLMRKVKQRATYLAVVCIILFAARLPEVLWLIVPSFQPDRFRLDWMDFSLPLSLLLLWCWPFLRGLDRLHSSPSDSGTETVSLPA